MAQNPSKLERLALNGLNQRWIKHRLYTLTRYLPAASESSSDSTEPCRRRSKPVFNVATGATSRSRTSRRGRRLTARTDSTHLPGLPISLAAATTPTMRVHLHASLHSSIAAEIHQCAVHWFLIVNIYQRYASSSTVKSYHNSFKPFSPTLFDCGKNESAKLRLASYWSWPFFSFLTFGHSGAHSWAPECRNVKKLKRVG